MKKITSLLIALVFACTISAQQTQESKFIARFQTFVVNVEKAQKVPSEKWDSLNTTYKAFRTEYRQKYKKTLNNTEYKKYNELKVRYLKQSSLKRFGNSISKKAQTVEGTLDGVFSK